MCSPMAAIGIAGAAMSMAQNYMVYQANQDAEADWMEYQRQKRTEEFARQDELRGKAEAARQQSMEAMAPEEQQQVVDQETERLKGYYGYQEPEEISIGDKLLSGQMQMDDTVSQDRARTIAEATQEANKRIAAMARQGAYTGSMYGLGTRNPLEFAKSGQGIELSGNKRGGSLGVYNIAKNVNPVRYQKGFDLGGAISGLGKAAFAPISMGV